jgi:thiosulfate/3-mercaptopyruvate sulfurtransferase
MSKQDPSFHTLITVDELSGLLETGNVVVLDCRYSLTDFSKGRKDYLQSHLPGAYFMDIGHDLSAPVIKGVTGRHPLPHPEILASSLRAAGVSHGSQVIAYDQSNGAYASRAWWLLRWLGHDQVAVLDGGFDAWIKSGLPVDNQWPAPKKGNFQFQLKQNLTVNVHEVAHLKEPIIDSRDYKRYTGEIEPIDPIAGHIKGALCKPYMDNTNENGFWKSVETLKNKFQDVESPEPVQPVFYCGSGVTACHNILAYKIATGKDARLYPGSWSEWIHYYPPVTGE